MSLTTPPGKVDLIRYKIDLLASEKSSMAGDLQSEQADEKHFIEKTTFLSAEAPY